MAKKQTNQESVTKKQEPENNSGSIALYTKYRPQSFDDVLGQDHIVSVLKESVRENNISHAYLFIGSRGTGKTSVARILAESIGTTKNDLHEIDAASNTGVEDIRALNDSVSISPLNSKYKVYILDEVHMLSKSAFNALLKTLEEPPQHVVFILATTEPHKIPETVISRCETYNFKTPNRPVLKKMIVKTATAEGIILSSQAVDLISILGDGSFRDTHTILQKLLRISSIVKDGEISVEEIEKVTGAPQVSLVNDLLLAIVSKNVDLGLRTIQIIGENNIDANIFYKLLIEKYRVLLLLKVAPNEKSLIEDSVGEDDLKFLSELLKNYSASVNSKQLLNLLESMNLSKKFYLPFLPLEILLTEKGS